MRLWDKSKILSELQSLKQPFTDDARFRDASTRSSEDGKDEPSSNSSFRSRLYDTSKDSKASSCPKASAGKERRRFRETFKAINVW